MKNKGITLVALVITIILLLILASVSINVLLGENGIIIKTKLAKEKYEKATATEIIKTKIMECQMDSYEEKGELPTLAYLAAFLEKDKKEIRDIEYVMLESKGLATLDESPYEDWDKIYTKLEKYPYEFEIDSSFKVAINGEPVESTIPAGYMKTPTETKEITENGNDIDVLNYAKVNVNVPLPEGFIKPIGTKSITTNGEYNIAEYEKVNVNIVTDKKYTETEYQSYGEEKYREGLEKSSNKSYKSGVFTFSAGQSIDIELEFIPTKVVFTASPSGASIIYNSEISNTKQFYLGIGASSEIVLNTQNSNYSRIISSTNTLGNEFSFYSKTTMTWHWHAVK